MATTDSTAAPEADLKRTPLHDLHVALGARMVPFAGYEMPVQYPTGILTEHLHTRAAAGLFDVSHMGQAWLTGPDHATTARALETLVPSNMVELGRGKQRYTVLLNAEGGIVDDLMVTRPVAEEDDGRLFLVVNASRKDVDYPLIAAALPEGVHLEIVEDRALIAVQGPEAVAAVALHAPDAARLGFMSAAWMDFDGIRCHVSRSGYTGEDGVEMSVPADAAQAIVKALLADERVKPIGLGARDSLRLEAGLCLYGHDLDETTSPVEGDITFILQKRRREEGGFPGAARVQGELAASPARKRVGLRLEGRAPAREGAEIRVPGGSEAIGTVTSGGFAPTLGQPIAMGYVTTSHSAPGTKLALIVRGKELEATVTTMPFVEHRYVRAAKA